MCDWAYYEYKHTGFICRRDFLFKQRWLAALQRLIQSKVCNLSSSRIMNLKQYVELRKNSDEAGALRLCKNRSAEAHE